MSAKIFLPGRSVVTGAGRKTGQRPDVIGYRDDLRRLQHAVLAEGQHGAFVRLGIARPRTELDRLFDLIELAAPDPLVVIEVGIALGAGAAGTVTGAQLSPKAALPLARASASSAGSFSISAAASPPASPSSRRGAPRDWRVRPGQSARRVAQQARGVAVDQRPGRIDDPVADRPDDGGIEGPHPP